jgi:hypothetical protein
MRLYWSRWDIFFVLLWRAVLVGAALVLVWTAFRVTGLCR